MNLDVYVNTYLHCVASLPDSIFFGIYIIHELIFQIMFYSTKVKTSYIKQETTAGERVMCG